MPKPELTEDIVKKTLRYFFREIPFIFLGTGMSCALDKNFGMPALKDELIAKMKNSKMSAIQQTEWRKVDEVLSKGIDLENALDLVTNQGLLEIIIKYTAKFIARNDKKYALEITNGKCEWPAIGTLKRIYDALPENLPILHVLTPNYDLLFE